ncbi:fungal-specific transcription factor domain-containing protein [Xylogone sp. PMI_703]|nr:fungal-specific transcription factor domain-containing protein [Xylogone sp. PMI_703]
MFILNGMFALAARFSTEYLPDADPKDRGVAFAKKAEKLYEKLTSLESFATPTLPFLQGCLLLVSYYLGCGICSRSWLLMGVCCRAAYFLRLHTLDRDIIMDGSQHDDEKWIKREEKRRCWWAIWELDNFVSTASGRPYGLNRDQMQVLLPVYDDTWFSNTPVASAPIKTDSLLAWKELEISPNQSERAWYLMSTYLVRLMSGIFEKSENPSLQSRKDIASVVDCFALALPRKFDLVSSGLRFDDQNWQNSCWIISTHLILESVAVKVGLWKFAEEILPSVTAASCTSENSYWSLRSTQKVIRAIRAWAPERMPFSPHVACTILGHHCMHIQNVRKYTRGEQYHGSDEAELEIELVKLSLKRHAVYWGLATHLIDLLNLCTGTATPEICGPVSKECPAVAQLPVISPFSLSNDIIA